MLFNIDTFSLIVIVVSLIISLSLHEAMHAFVGLKLGDTTAQEAGRVSFNPLRHIDPLTTIVLPVITLLIFHVPILAAKPVPFDPQRLRYNAYGPALIALAGPLTNLALAVLGGLLLHSVAVSASVYTVLYIFTVLNVGLFVFNMVPIPPLDGSRALYVVAPEPVQEFMARIEQFGIFIVFGLVLAVPAFTRTLVNIDTNIIHFLVNQL